MNICAPDTKNAEVTTLGFEEWYAPALLSVARFVSARGGTLDDAREVLHDALIQYSEGTTDRIIETPEQYVAGIARHLWLRRWRSKERIVSLDVLGETPVSKKQNVPDASRLLELVRASGKKCLDLLISFYFRKEDMTTIASQFGFRTTHSASVQKYKCIEKIRDTVKANQLEYEDFIKDDTAD